MPIQLTFVTDTTYHLPNSIGVFRILWRGGGVKLRCQRHRWQDAKDVEEVRRDHLPTVGGSESGCAPSAEIVIFYSCKWYILVHFYTLETVWSSSEGVRFSITLLVKLCNIYFIVLLLLWASSCFVYFCFGNHVDNNFCCNILKTDAQLRRKQNEYLTRMKQVLTSLQSTGVCQNIHWSNIVSTQHTVPSRRGLLSG